MSLADAHTVLSSIDGLGRVIDAAARRDVQAILDLSRKGNYCDQSTREPLPECQDTTEVTGVYHRYVIVMNPILRPVETMKTWMTDFFAGAGSTLVFASRDNRQPEGAGGPYYLSFQRPGPVAPWGGGVYYDRPDLTVAAGKPQPIQEIAFGIVDSNGLRWVQELGGEDGALHQELIAPESVADWPGVLDNGRRPR